MLSVVAVELRKSWIKISTDIETVLTPSRKKCANTSSNQVRNDPVPCGPGRLNSGANTVERNNFYLTTLITRVIDIAVKPGTAGAYSCSVKVPFFAPGFNTTRICAASPL